MFVVGLSIYVVDLSIIVVCLGTYVVVLSIIGMMILDFDICFDTPTFD